MNNNLVSIIVPVYNLEKYIAICLDSLLSQTYSYLEIIVVDDGSTDSSWNIIAEYAKKDKRITALQQKNGGAAKARNTALNAAIGVFFTFVDGDDTLSEEAIESNISFLEKDTSLDWVTFPIHRITKEGKEICSARNYSGFIPDRERILLKKELIPVFIQRGLSGLACGAIYRQSSMGALRFPEGEYYEDSFYFTAVLAQTKKAMISIFGMYGYVVRAESSQLTKVDKKRLQSKTNMLNQRVEQWSKICPEAVSEYRKWESDLYYSLKTAMAKKVPGANEVWAAFKKQMHYPLQINIALELKIAAYKWIGYQRLMKILEKLINNENNI
ncbi:hypothetical protein FACS189421_04160 [Bacteroidia bacterium]|nr:hypothetical protein FACS189421_04160 [Bacteroidia bacterium]GHT48094.1 hypothetical protein FACS189440_10800 [Bacteroidia bacterium]